MSVTAPSVDQQPRIIRGVRARAFVISAASPDGRGRSLDLDAARARHRVAQIVQPADGCAMEEARLDGHRVSVRLRKRGCGRARAVGANVSGSVTMAPTRPGGGASGCVSGNQPKNWRADRHGYGPTSNHASPSMMPMRSSKMTTSAVCTALLKMSFHCVA